ncbi:hypothetical protein QTP88_017666 [Uroleucon formosanum]
MFFGTVQQASGSNHHQSMPTFLQLYKLLSIYSLLQPPKSGNCQVLDDSLQNHIITISEIKNVLLNSEKQSNMVETLKIKVDKIIEEENWEFVDVVKHDYVKAEIVDCLIYYLTGYLCKQLTYYTKDYQVCKTSFISHQGHSQQI